MVKYSCPKCYNDVITAKKGDIETCKNCFATSYLDDDNNSVEEGHNSYMEKLAKSG